MIGRTVSHYRITEKLGEGGMGVVYRAEDTRLNRIVALKFLSPRSGSDEGEKDRLLREARAAAALDHPNICPVYEIDEAGGHAFIAMACVEGRSLAAMIADGALSLDDALSYAIQMADGLSAAHSKGIVHRDIKPGNVMVSPNGQVRIMDFGLAGRFEPVSVGDRATTSGTAAYMSPEQLRGEQADARSDTWALGVVLHEMLTGKRPFQGVYEQAIVYSVLNLEPEPVSSARPDVPEGLARVIAKALEKDQENRYQTAGEFLADLTAVGARTVDGGSDRRPIAVTTFENLTGDDAYDYLRRAIPNLLITSLEQSRHLKVITWERMGDVMKQLGRGRSEIVDRDLGFEVCRLAGAEALVTGSFVRAGTTFATDAKVLDAKSKDLIVSASSRGDGVDSILLKQIDELAAQILAGVEPEEGVADGARQPIAEVATASMDAYKVFLRGRDSYERLYNSDARELLEKAVALDPSFAVAHLYLAWTYTRLRDNRSRDEAFERAKACSDRATPRQRLYIDAAYARTIEQDSEKELRILLEIVRTYPDEKRAHHRLAGYYRAQGRFYQAIEEYNRVLELDPEYGWAINELAYMYTDVEDFEKASEYFERYAKASPGDANPIDSMGELCFRMGRLDCAISHYREALALKPDFYYAYWEIAYVSALMEMYDEALTWIDDFVSTAPSSGTKMGGRRWRCFYLLWLGRFQQGIGEAAEIARLAAEQQGLLWTVEASRLTGWIHFVRGEFGRSRTCFDECAAAIDSAPEEFVPAPTSFSSGSLKQVRQLRAEYDAGLALIDIAEGDFESARARLAAVTSLRPELAELVGAELDLAEGSVEKVITIGERSRPWRVPYMSDTEGMLTYNLPPIRDTLARAYVRSGELFKAITEYERLLTVDQTTKDRRLVHPTYHFRLAKLYERKNWLDQARARYVRFLDVWGEADKGHPDVKEARSRLAALDR
jgi:serine/threonine protein kinase/Tfp pilus assembly protein PilF